MYLNPRSRQAAKFAKEAHMAIGQVRKYTGEPYHTHPFAVAKRVSAVRGATDEMVAAAYLHDVLEDTPVSLATLMDTFGTNVAAYVLWLSDLQTSEHGNRAFRKQNERTHLSMAPDEVQTIKLADLIDNAPSIIEHDPLFARLFITEMRKLLKVMTRGDQYLDHQAWGIVHDYESKD